MRNHLSSKVLILLLSVFLFWGLNANLLPTVSAATDVWDGSVAASFSGGTGTVGEPYQIATGEQLAYLATLVSGGNAAYQNAYYQLTADIDLNHLQWTPIGTATKDFYGNFDGQNHKVSNLAIGTSSSYVTTLKFNGLFGYTGFTQNTASIRNIGVVNAAIYVNYSTVGSRIGCLVGYINGTVSNCYATGTISSLADNSYIGGLIGHVNPATVTSSYTVVDITGAGSTAVDLTSTTLYTQAGGLIGRNNNDTAAAVTNCYALGTVNCTGSAMAGGLIGYWGSVGKTNAIITNCYATGNVSAAAGLATKVGGFVGFMVSGVTNTSYWNSTVIAVGVGTNNSSSAPFAKSSTEMQSDAFYQLLNTNTGSNIWQKDSGNVNQGYPMLTGIGVGYISNTTPTYSNAANAVTVFASESAFDLKSYLHASDTDASQSLTWSQQSAPAHGSLSFSAATAATGSADISPGGTISYTPAAGYCGSDTFAILVSDGSTTATKSFTATVYAATDTWDGSKAATFAAGDGSVASPYLIGNAEQLAYLSDLLNNSNATYRSYQYKLMANLDLAQIQWIPMATSNSNLIFFDGVFDGNNHMITNLAIGTSTSPNTTFGNAGLFGYIYGGTLQNLGLANVSIYSGYNSASVGGLAGAVSGYIGITSHISNCFTTGYISSADNYTYVGGIAGSFAYSTINNCSSSGSIKGGTDASAGGLLGMAQISGTITDCYSTSSVIANGGEYPSAGGLIGYLGIDGAGVPSTTITACYATGNVTCSVVEYLGGLIGYSDGGTIVRSYHNSQAAHVRNATVLAAKGVGSSQAGKLTGDSIPQTVAELQSNTFLTTLNHGSTTWNADLSLKNFGFPILAFTPPVITNLYQITYDGNLNTTGSSPIDTGLYPSGLTIAVAGNPGELAKSGAEFGGWNTLSNGSGTNYIVGSDYPVFGNATLYAQWNPTIPTVTLSIKNSLMMESSGTATVTAALSAAYSQDTTVSFSYSGTATRDTDYTAAASLVISAGMTEGGFTITSTDDGLVEENETILIDISAILNGIESGDQQVITVIINDDTAPAVASILRKQPLGSLTNASNLVYRVTFSKIVTGVDTNDFALVTSGTVSASIISVSSVSGAIYDVTLSSVSGSGSLRLDLNAGGTGICDSAGNAIAAAAFTSGEIYTVDQQAPTVLSVNVPAAATYRTGATLSFNVNFSENVAVVNGSNSALEINIGGSMVNAAYSSGSATSSLQFIYTVLEGQLDTDGIVITSLSSIGENITDPAGNAALLTLNSIASTAGVQVDAVAPVVNSVTVPSPDTYIIGNRLSFIVNFSEAVNLVLADQDSQAYLSLSIGSTTVQVSYLSGSGSENLTFTYTIAADDADDNGVELATAIHLAGAAIQDAANNQALLTLNNVGSTTAVLVDAIIPTVSSVAVPANGVYTTGQTLDFTVVFSESVSTNNPYLLLTIGGRQVQVNYSSGSGSPNLLFRYTVLQNDLDMDGISCEPLIATAGSWLTDLAGNPAELTLHGMGNTSLVTVDAVAASITSVTVPAADTYRMGETLDFTVYFSENVTLTETRPDSDPLHLILTIGQSIVHANYLSGSGSNAILFRYTVLSGDTDTDSIGLGTLISGTGESLFDAAGNEASRVLNEGINTNLIYVDAIVPTVSSVSLPVAGVYSIGSQLDFILNCSEDVFLNNPSPNLGGNPYLELTLESSTVKADYLSGSGSSALLFRYTIAENDLDPDGIVVAGALNKLTYDFFDAAGNTINPNLPLESTASVLVDAVRPVITQVTVPAAKTYKLAETLLFTVHFSEPVAVTSLLGGSVSQAYLPLRIGSNTVEVEYRSGSNTNALVFSYTIVRNDFDSDGITVLSPIDAVSSKICDLATNEADLTLSSVGDTAAVLVDAVLPQVTSVSVPAADTYLAGESLNFSIQFSKIVWLSEASGLKLELIIGGSSVNADYTSGSGTTVLNFASIVQENQMDTDGITVGLLALNLGSALKDAAGNDAELALTGIASTSGVFVDAVKPVVVSVHVPADGIYIIGQSLRFTVNFSEPVLLPNESSLVLNVTVGESTVDAAYLSGSGTTALQFNYTVTAGQLDTDGIALAAALRSVGENLKDAAGNAASLTLNAIAPTVGIKVDAVIPVIIGVSVPDPDTYITGESLIFTVHFSEPISLIELPYVTRTAYLGLTIGSTPVLASFLDGINTENLTFRYTVAAGEQDTDGIQLANAISTISTTIQDMAGNPASLTLNHIGSTTAVLVDAITPTVSSVSVPADGVYTAGQTLDFMVRFSELVKIEANTPYMLLTIGGRQAEANYASGSGSSSLLFRYTIEENDLDTDGIAYAAAIAAAGSGISDLAGNPAELTLHGMTSTSFVTVDAVAPAVLSLSVPLDDTYCIGETLIFTVTFTETITVEDLLQVSETKPYLSLTIGSAEQKAQYLSGSGSNALLFGYTICEGDLDTDGIVLASAIINGTYLLYDAAGNHANLTINQATSTTAVRVDGVLPFVTSLVIPVNSNYKAGSVLTFTVNFSETVKVEDLTQGLSMKPYLTLTIGNQVVRAEFTTGSNSTALNFAYLVASGDFDDDGIDIDSDFSVNGCSIKDLAGNDAVNAISNIPVSTGVLIDGIAPNIVSVILPLNGSYGISDLLEFTVVFSEPVELESLLDSLNSSLLLGLTITAAPVNAEYVNGSGTESLVFRYTVAEGDFDSDGIRLAAALTTSGASLKDAAGNPANLSLLNAGNTDGILIDGIAPVVTAVTLPPNKTYKTGENLDFYVQFSETVHVGDFILISGEQPFLTVTLDSRTVEANYVNGSNTNTLLFRYTVSAGDSDSDGILLAPEITIIGSSIHDTVGNPAYLHLHNVSSTAAILLDAIAPYIISVSVPANGYYIAADELEFIVDFSEPTFVPNGSNPILGVIVGNSMADAAYLSGSGSSALRFVYTVASGENDADGLALTASITLSGASIKDLAGNDAILTLNNSAATDGIFIDTILPSITAAVLSTDNSFVDLTFSEGIFGPVTLIRLVSPAELNLVFAQNNGSALTAAISSVKKADSLLEASASNLSGEETVLRVFITLNGIPAGLETIQIKPSNAQALLDIAGNAVAFRASSGILTLHDQTAPQTGADGTLTTGEIAVNSAALTWTAATDSCSAQGTLQYRVIYCLQDTIATVTEAMRSGSVATDWTANLSEVTVSNLRSHTTYYLNVLVKDEAGNMAVYTPESITTDMEDAVIPPSPVIIEVNGVKQDAGNSAITTVEEKTVETILVDDTRLEGLLAQEGNHAIVTIPFANTSDIFVSNLNGQTVKAMEEKEAVLQIRTENITYTLPANQISILDVSQQFGTQIELKDIQVNITISSSSNDTARIVRDTASRNQYQIVVEPVDFAITCTSGEKTVEVAKFNGYVERTIAIPEGIDPARVTTGIVLNSDGSFSHVPTTIVVIEGKYYAKINSLTNSTYAVIYHPMEFADTLSHWASAAINDLGSRLIVSGVSTTQYEPERSISRAEFAAILVRALGLQETISSSRFSDVAVGAWYSGYIETASNYGIVAGYSNGQFGPQDKISREQAMTMIGSAMKLTKLYPILTQDDVNTLFVRFRDSEDIAGYAKADVAACLSTGIVSGRSSTELAPQDFITRAEVAVIAQQLLQKSNLI